MAAMDCLDNAKENVEKANDSNQLAMQSKYRIDAVVAEIKIISKAEGCEDGGDC
jgi:hypothetical protein